VNRRVFGYVLPGMAALLSGWLLLAMAGLPARGQQPAGEATTPEAAAVKICSSCHGMQMVTDTPRDYDAWHDTVQKMIDRGARGTPEEFDLVMDFLFQNVTPIDVNHADAETLVAILHTSPEVAQAIIARRTSRPFKDLADLESAAGLDKVLLDAKKRMIFFQ
jgi:Helix-hairpin-helix motif